MNTHTPAPWKVLIDEDEKYPISIIDPTTENHPQGPVHICNINPNLGEESEANAHLIAAAPELLQALRDILDMVTDNRLHGPEVLAAANAIAKAEG